MNIETIRRNAPVGATHYCDDCLGFDYVKMVQNGMYTWNERFKDWLFVGYLNYEHDFKPL